MGFFSKVWKGIKKTVKKVARAVKKVSKKIITSLPGGKKLWEFGTKIGKGIEKGIAKIAGKLGPIGTMALSFVLAPIMGPAIGALWSGFGAGAAAMAGSANAIVGALGTAGTAIFNGVNFVSGTVGALGKALTEGVKLVGKGQFGAAGEAFMTNMKAAFSGKAGTSAMNAAAAKATNAAQIKGFEKSFGDLPRPDEILKGTDFAPDPLKDFDLGMRDIEGGLLRPGAQDIPTGSSIEFSDFNNIRQPAAIGEGSVLDPKFVETTTGIPQSQQGVPSNLPVTPGEGTVLAEPPSFLDKAKDAVKNASELTRGGSGENSGAEVAGADQGLRRTIIDGPGQVQPIEAAGGGGSSLWEQLIAQASRQTRGGFA